jgi:hypothetical protein
MQPKKLMDLIAMLQLNCGRHSYSATLMSQKPL